jgi:hypothetical protein
MMELTGELLQPQEVVKYKLECLAMDAVEVEAAHKASATELPKCRFAVQVLVAVRFGVDADMIIPVPMCAIHFNAFNISMHEGIVFDTDLF